MKQMSKLILQNITSCPRLLLCAAFAILTGCATTREDEQEQEIVCHDAKAVVGEHKALSPATNAALTGERQCSGSTITLEGLSLAEARLDYVSNVLIVRFNETDSVKLMGFNPNDAFRSFSDVFEFSGERVCARDLIAKGFDLAGTKESEIIAGTNATDRISGYSGNDTLNGNDGDDVYYYEPGDGLDCISDRSGQDVIEFRGGLSANNITAGLSLRDGRAIVRLRLRDSKKRISRKDGIDVLLNAEGDSPIETVRFPDGTACLFSGILRSAPKLTTSGGKTSSETTCFFDPTLAQQAGLVNARARPITPPPMPTPIRVPADSTRRQMFIMGSDGKPRSVENKSVEQ